MDKNDIMEESLDDIICILNKSTNLYSKNIGPDILKDKKDQENQSQDRFSPPSKQDSLTQFMNQQNSSKTRPTPQPQNQQKQVPNYLKPTLHNSAYGQSQQFRKQQQQQNNNGNGTNQNSNNNNNGISKIIRYLQFAAWDGTPAENVDKSNGYYFTVLNGTASKVLKGVLECNGFSESNKNDWIIMWSCNTIKSEVYNCLMPYQKVNHFPKSIEITRKDLMNRNLSKMQIQYGVSNFNFFPKTYILPSETHVFLDDAEKLKNQWYIIKPSGSSQGKGIFISDNVQEILSKIGQGSQTVISHYIMNPLLINNLKFDLRLYIVVTSINPLRIYLYDEGLTRFATQEYNVAKGDQKNRFAHLTNYSINKNATGFVKNNNAGADGEGNKWSLTALKDFLRINNMNVDQIFDRVDDLLIKTIISIENQICGAFEMHVPYRNNCFQLFGFDILIDSNLKPWLLEVNLAPSLNGDSPLDLKIKGGLLSDIFTLIGVVPLDQRYTIDTSYNYTNNNILKDKNYQNILSNAKNMKNGINKQQLSNLERYVIKESEDELKRARNFKRIYPTHTAQRYKNYFEVERPFNALLRNHELSKSKTPNQPASLQQMHSNNQNKQTISYIQNNMNNTSKDVYKTSLISYNLNNTQQILQQQQQQQQNALKAYNRKQSLLNTGEKTLNTKQYLQ